MSGFTINTPTAQAIPSVATISLLATAINVFVDTLVPNSYTNFRVQVNAFISSTDVKSYDALITFDQGSNPA